MDNYIIAEYYRNLEVFGKFEAIKRLIDRMNKEMKYIRHIRNGGDFYSDEYSQVNEAEQFLIKMRENSELDNALAYKAVQEVNFRNRVLDLIKRKEVDKETAVELKEMLECEKVMESAIQQEIQNEVDAV